MPSTPSPRLRAELQALGENLNTWGDGRLNAALTRLEEAIADVVPIAITGTSYVLTSTNYVADEARGAALIITGTLAGNTTITAPTVEKLYLIDNRTTQGSYSLTIKTAAGTGYALRPGPQKVFCDGSDFARGEPRLDQAPLPASSVDMNAQRLMNLPTPTSDSDAATKKYVDDTAFASAGGTLPGQTGNAGAFLTTNGSVASWATAPVLSFNGRTGAIAPQAGDYTPAQVGALPTAGGSMGGNVIQSAKLQDPRYARVDRGAASSGTVTFDVSAAPVQQLTVSGSLNIAFSGWPSDTAGLMLRIVNGGAGTLAWTGVNFVRFDGLTQSTPTRTLQASGTDWIAVWRDNGTVYAKVV